MRLLHQVLRRAISVKKCDAGVQRWHSVEAVVLIPVGRETAVLHKAPHRDSQFGSPGLHSCSFT